MDDEQFQRELIGDGSPSDASAGAKARKLMGESAKRLSASDPGEATQYVQEQIVREIDRLIEEQASRPAPAPRSGKPGRDGKQQQQVPGKPGPASEPGHSKSAAAAGNPGGSAHVESADDLRSAAETWGKISPKLRGPVVEGRSERVMRKYYYRAVAVKAAE